MPENDIIAQFAATKEILGRLHSQYAGAAQELGFLSENLRAAEPYWVAKAAEAASDPSQDYIVGSGTGALAGLNTTLSAVASASHVPIDLIHFASATGVTFASNTAATSQLFPAISLGPLKESDLPRSNVQDATSLAARFSKLDPQLGATCRGAFECLYGTCADPERLAMFGFRQTWDHFFSVVAPDPCVRSSSFWKSKAAHKPDEVTRMERINYAAHEHISDPVKRDAILSQARLMVDLYDALNRAHTRGSYNKETAKEALHSLYNWLQQWADAMHL